MFKTIMTKSVVWCVVVAALALNSTAGHLVPQDARIINLQEIGITEPQGIAYHPIRQTLFIVTKNPGQVFELTHQGQVLNSFMVPDIRKPEGITYDPVTGKLMISRGNNVIWVADADGSSVTPFVVLQESTDADGVAVHPMRGTIFVTDDDATTVFEFDRSGQVLNRFNTAELVPGLTEPQGIGFYGTDLIVADDLTDALYLFSPQGELLQTLVDTAPFGSRDPEGVAVIGQQEVCSISDNDALLICFALPQVQLDVPFRLDLKDSFIGLAVVNSGTSGNPLNAYGYTPSGWQTLFDQVPLPETAQVAKLTQEIGCCGKGLQGGIWEPPVGQEPEAVQALTLTGQRGPLQGFFMVGDFSLQHLDGVGGSRVEATRQILPAARQNDTQRTTIFVTNPSGILPATVQLDLFEPQGNVVQTATETLPPFGSIQRELAQIFGAGLQVDQGYVQVTSDLPVRALEFSLGDSNLTAAGGQDGDRSGTLVAPQFFVGESVGHSTLTLINLAEETNTATVEAFDDLGQKLAETRVEIGAHQMLHSDVGDLLGLDPSGPTLQGYLMIRHRGPSAGGFTAQGHLAGLVTFEDSSGESRSSLALQSEASEVTLFPHVAQSRDLGIFQGLALLNRSTQTAEIQIEVYAGDGTLTNQVAVAIGGSRRLVALLDDQSLFGAGFEQQGGYLKITSDRPLMSFSLFGGARFLSAIERLIPLSSQ